MVEQRSITSEEVHKQNTIQLEKEDSEKDEEDRR